MNAKECKVEALPFEKEDLQPRMVLLRGFTKSQVRPISWPKESSSNLIVS
jgi:hypothetical protein